MASNQQIADIFDRVALLLETQDASLHRVRAWREGGSAVLEHPEPLEDVFRERGRVGLEELPHIGRGLASVIIEILKTGRARVLERLEGEVVPEDLFADLPGIGRALAQRIHRELDIDTLEELEIAAHDGRLARLGGFGDKRVKSIQEALDARLTRMGRTQRPPETRPSTALLLEIDRRYRELSGAGRLRKIAPRRFNPKGEAWLPILHVEKDSWDFTALFSNTALAHDLGKTQDWVIVYYARDGAEGRATIVTETHGPYRGRRVVRGREAESAQWQALPT